MAPSLSTLAVLSLAATSLAAPTTLEARKAPAISFIDSAIESVAGKACGLWAVIHHSSKPVVKPSCEQWVADATKILPFRMVTGVYEGKCKSWNVRVASNNVATPECAEGHRHGGKDVEDVLDGDKDHRAGGDVKDEEEDDDDDHHKKPSAWEKKQDEEEEKKKKEEDREDKAIKEQEEKDKKKQEERIKEEKENAKDKDGDGKEDKQKRQVITMEKDGKRVEVPDLWSDVKQE